MIESIINFSCRNKFLVIAFFIAMAACGYYVMRKTPVDAIPDLSENQVIVFTDWMGRSPQEIQDQITYPLSVNLQGLAGVKTIRSSSEFNFSMINIIFEDDVDFYFARTRVLERLTLASTFLPQGVVPYLAPDATALGQIFWYTVEGENHDLGELRAIQDWYVRYQLNSVPGVAQVSSVGGFPKEYQVDITPERLRAYNLTIGQIYDAIARSNSAVGGRVVHKGNAEYLIRGVGWLRSVDDIRKVVITARNGQPILVGDVAVVQLGSEFRRSVLEKDGKEVVGGVVMMRYGENPLEVTQRIKEKIRGLEKGLADKGVRIIPFYDRTRLIEGAIHTFSTVLEHEIIIATLAILLILMHFRSAFVIVITLPLSILFAFILMKFWPWGSISSNIMSLSGIAISIGILVDQSIVMLENCTHRLTQHFGDKRIEGDTTEIVAGACRQVGRPIFFSVLIMVLSFLPVFALTGEEGKMFHPLAFTKTFALLGTAIISITLVPAIIPLLIRGRLSKEEHNWIVRSFIEMYRPVLGFLMKKPRTVCVLFAILLGVGLLLARHLGGEFMPPLDEGSILDMPTTSPRASVTETANDLMARDAMLREMPEVESVVGKSGRAETPTDPSPLDMVETVVGLRPREHWLKRKMNLSDAKAAAERLSARLEQSGALKPFTDKNARDEFLGAVASDALVKFDAEMRLLVSTRQMTFEGKLAEDSARFIDERLLEQIDQRKGWAALGTGTDSSTAANRSQSPMDREAMLSSMLAAQTDLISRHPLLGDVERVVDSGVKFLRDQQLLGENLTDPLAIPSGAWDEVRYTLGAARKDFYERTAEELETFRFGKTKEWVHQTNTPVFYEAMPVLAKVLLKQAKYQAKMLDAWNEDAFAKFDVAQEIKTASGELQAKAFLWPKTKADLVNELDTAIRVPGWSNAWTQPIINRVDMLATGVRTQVGVMVFAKNLDDIQKVSDEVAAVLSGIPGAEHPIADQTKGKGYIEVQIDRERAARYALNVGDIQDVIETALGGKSITTTVEGPERFPVRLRYARDYRVDEESIKRILVTGGGGSAAPSAGGPRMGTGTDSQTAANRSQSPSAGELPAITLSDVATVKVVEGPTMIKSENGLLRAYVQLNVRDRDIMSFVDEAKRVVNAKVKLPPDSHLEWTGQYEHQVRARDRLRIVFPAVLVLIFLILYITYNDFAHALLMMLAVPGALAGGVIFQTIFGYNFSVAVWVGYIACFGMATETGIIMLVYLRDAIAERGGLKKIGSLAELEQAVIAGAVHRLRPKLLTEGTAIVGLAPMLWASGVGAEVIAPMAAPVLGGLLIADEVIDIFLPVLLYQVEAHRWKKLHPEYAESPATPVIPNSSIASEVQLP